MLKLGVLPLALSKKVKHHWILKYYLNCKIIKHTIIVGQHLSKIIQMKLVGLIIILSTQSYQQGSLIMNS